LKLTCVLATRGRPTLLVPTIMQTLFNATLTETRLLIAADADDAATVAALGNLPALDGRLQVSVREREDTLWEKYNRALDEAPADVYLHMADYAPLATRGFDERVLEAAALFPDNIGVVYSGLANMSFPAAEGVTAGLAAKLGWIFPPYFPYWFGDHWIDDIARLIGRIAYADIAVDCSRRPGTQEMREPAFWGSFYDAMALLRRRQARAITTSPEFQEPAWRKEILLRHHPLIEFRSQKINDIVRSMGMGGPAPDERYVRVKAAAISLLSSVVAVIEAEEATIAINKRAAA
jgi:hypothetical protein